MKQKRSEFNELYEKYIDKKKGYDAKTAELEGSLGNLEQVYYHYYFYEEKVYHP